RSGASPSTRCSARSSPGPARPRGRGSRTDAPMLSWLSIPGLALVDRIELSFDPSLNVLTGETGAGKSIILGSIALLLGERADPDWLRAGEAKGFVEGVFDLKALDDLLEALRESVIEAEE